MMYKIKVKARIKATAVLELLVDDNGDFYEVLSVEDVQDVEDIDIKCEI